MTQNILPGYLSLGLVYEQSKKLDKAIECYNAAIKINPKEIKSLSKFSNSVQRAI